MPLWEELGCLWVKNGQTCAEHPGNPHKILWLTNRWTHWVKTIIHIFYEHATSWSEHFYNTSCTCHADLSFCSRHTCVGILQATYRHLRMTCKSHACSIYPRSVRSQHPHLTNDSNAALLTYDTHHSYVISGCNFHYHWKYLMINLTHTLQWYVPFSRCYLRWPFNPQGSCKTHLRSP